MSLPRHTIGVTSELAPPEVPEWDWFHQKAAAVNQVVHVSGGVQQGLSKCSLVLHFIGDSFERVGGLKILLLQYPQAILELTVYSRGLQLMILLPQSWKC